MPSLQGKAEEVLITSPSTRPPFCLSHKWCVHSQTCRLLDGHMCINQAACSLGLSVYQERSLW